MNRDIKIYVANLGAYNAGYIRGGWFTLPTPLEEIFKVVFKPHELDEDGQPHGDYAIHDYEAPFEIHEYSNIDRLNKIAETFESLSDEDIELIVELKNQGIISDLLDGEDALKNVVHYDGCKDMSDVAQLYLENQYNEREHPLIFKHFNYQSYGEELESSNTFIHLNNSIVAYTG